jgi:hypothetical protein
LQRNELDLHDTNDERKEKLGERKERIRLSFSKRMITRIVVLVSIMAVASSYLDSVADHGGVLGSQNMTITTKRPTPPQPRPKIPTAARPRTTATPRPRTTACDQGTALDQFISGPSNSSLCGCCPSSFIHHHSFVYSFVRSFTHTYISRCFD